MRLVLVFAMIRHRFPRLLWIWVDGGYTGTAFGLWVLQTYHWILRVVRRPDEAKGFVKLPVRWRVERTFGWLNWCHSASEHDDSGQYTHDDSGGVAICSSKHSRIAEWQRQLRKRLLSGVGHAVESIAQLLT